MSKLPVGATIAAAYRFVFGSFIDLLGITWLPSVVMLAFGYVIDKTALPVQPPGADMVTPHGRVLLYIVPFELLAFAVIAVMITGIAQQALELRTGSAKFYFSVGKPVWRLIGAYLLVALTFLLGAFGLLLLAAIVTGIAGLAAHAAGGGKIAVGLLAVVAVLGLYGFLLYASARLTFFITPVTIAEGRISLRRAWAMGKGNFWRIVAIGLAVCAPILAMECAFLFATIPHDFFNVPPIAAGPPARAAYNQMVQAQTAAMQARNLQYWYVLDPYYLLLNTVFLGLVTGSQCFGYRAVAAQERAI